MASSGRVLTGERWERIEGRPPRRVEMRGRSGPGNRLFEDVIPCGNAARSRDPPAVFGKRSGVHARFRRWSHGYVGERLFHVVADPS